MKNTVTGVLEGVYETDISDMLNLFVLVFSERIFKVQHRFRILH